MKTKNKLWVVRVPPFLDKELREFIQRNNASRINFIRKSISYLCEDNPPQQDGKRGVIWLISLHPSLHKKVIEVVKSNYPSRSSFVRYAVTRQLITEIYLDEEMKRLRIENRVLTDSLKVERENVASLLSRLKNCLHENYSLKHEIKELKRN